MSTENPTAPESPTVEVEALDAPTKKSSGHLILPRYD
jgi:hypothetical protein